MGDARARFLHEILQARRMFRTEDDEDEDEDDEDEELFRIPPQTPHGKKIGSRSGFSPRIKAKW